VCLGATSWANETAAKTSNIDTITTFFILIILDFWRFDAL
jgi:hypothetical protein